MIYVNRLRGVHRDLEAVPIAEVFSFLKGGFGYKKTPLTDLVKDESIPLRDTTLLHLSLAGAGLTGYRHTLAL